VLFAQTSDGFYTVIVATSWKHAATSWKHMITPWTHAITTWKHAMTSWTRATQNTSTVPTSSTSKTLPLAPARAAPCTAHWLSALCILASAPRTSNMVMIAADAWAALAAAASSGVVPCAFVCVV
jgi:hypothetical protein